MKEANIMDNTNGRSMVEMLGVLAIIAVLSIGALAGFSNALYKHKMNETVTMVTNMLQSYAVIKEKSGVVAGDAEDASAFGVLSGVPVTKSSLDHTTNVWKTPLGEIGVKLNEANTDDMDCDRPGGGDGPHFGRSCRMNTTHDIHVVFTGTERADACKKFLSYGWQDALPPEWKHMALGVISANTKKLVWFSHGFSRRLSFDPLRLGDMSGYGENTKASMSMKDVATACDYCSNSAYCDVVFEISTCQ